MIPGIYDIVANSNASFGLSITVQDSTGTVIDFSSGYTAKMLVVYNGATVIELTNSNSMITLGSSSPNVVLSIPVVTMEGLVCPDGRYDLIIFSSSIQYCWISGSFVINQGITT